MGAMLFLYKFTLSLCFYPHLHSTDLKTRTTMSQKALLLEEVGKPLTLGRRIIPEPGENQLLVKVLVAGRKFQEHVYLRRRIETE